MGCRGSTERHDHQRKQSRHRGQRFRREDVQRSIWQDRKATEDVSISGDQFPLAGIDVSVCAKTIDLQFKDELVGIERLDAA